MIMVGFTGTQRGMTQPQLDSVQRLLVEGRAALGQWFIHGDCIGADSQAAVIAIAAGYLIWIKPSNIEAKRGWGTFDICDPAFPPLERNNSIVAESTYLIAAPYESYEVRRSGTWYTIRHAKKLDKIVKIVYPSGEVKED